MFGEALSWNLFIFISAYDKYSNIVMICHYHKNVISILKRPMENIRKFIKYKKKTYFYFISQIYPK